MSLDLQFYDRHCKIEDRMYCSHPKKKQPWEISMIWLVFLLLTPALSAKPSWHWWPELNPMYGGLLWGFRSIQIHFEHRGSLEDTLLGTLSYALAKTPSYRYSRKVPSWVIPSSHTLLRHSLISTLSRQPLKTSSYKILLAHPLMTPSQHTTPSSNTPKPIK